MVNDPSTKRPQIVFFGSGPVAAKSLELLSTHCDIEAVITKPQPPHHKEPFPVLEVAERLGVPTYTPVGKRELSELFATTFSEEPLRSRLGIVIDYGFIINQDVIDYFPLGIINSHFSLLPEWRGADPITFAILSGQKETGISLMLITAGMDEGPILAYAPFDIRPGMTTPELTDELIELSDWTLQDILPAYIEGRVTARPQLEAALSDHTAVSFSRKLTKEDGILDFNKSAEQLEREIRAFAEWPRSRMILVDTPLTITEARVSDKKGGKTGTTWLEDKRFGVYCADGSLEISRLIPAGKREMTAEAFLAGYRHLFKE
jgi:methionyl-tRNA formyltransferase